MDLKFDTSKKICILMSTFNGSEFIERQIESILAQTYKNWELIIADDSSTDGTLDKIKFYISKYPKKIRLLDIVNHNYCN